MINLKIINDTKDEFKSYTSLYRNMLYINIKELGQNGEGHIIKTEYGYQAGITDGYNYLDSKFTKELIEAKKEIYGMALKYLNNK